MIKVPRILEYVLNISDDHLVLIGTDFRVRYFNKKMSDALFRYFDRHIQLDEDYREYVREEAKNIFHRFYDLAMKGEVPEVELDTQGDGFTIFFHYKFNRVMDEDDQILGVLMTARDITQRKKDELQLKKTNQELTLLNKVNDLVLDIADKDELLNLMCREIIETGKYKLAWICSEDDIDSKTGEIHIRHGHGQMDYIRDISIMMGDEKHARGPTGTVLREGRIVLTNKVSTSHFEPWRKAAEKYGLAATIALPVRFGENCEGCLNIYSDREDAFDENELRILERLARNVSQALCWMETDRERDEYNLQLNERISELRTIYNISTVFQDESVSFDVVLQRVVNCLPEAWLHPVNCSARIRFGQQVFVTDHFEVSALVLSAGFVTMDQLQGEIEVHFKETDDDEPYFVREEKEMLNSIAELIRIHYNKFLVQKRLSETRKNLSSVFENTRFSHLLMDKDLNILEFNRNFFEGYKELTGFEIEKGRNFMDFVHPERRETGVKLFGRIAKKPASVNYVSSFEHNGKSLHYRVSIQPVMDGTVFKGFNLSGVDITESKNLELERFRMIDDLSARNADLERFAYIVSHNLRSPVVNILGLAELLEAGQLGEEEREFSLRSLKKAASTLDSVLHDLNEILNIRDSLNNGYEMVSLKQVFDDVLLYFGTQIGDRKAQIITRFEPEQEVLSIKPYIHSIFYNLLSNSFKFAQPDIPLLIEVSTSIVKNQMLVKYIDNGKGIDTEKHKDHLFGLYKRFDKKTEGRGMGLYLIKNQIEVMGGSISLESTPGQGVRFEIRLPLRETQSTGSA